ncbi:MAG: hypothetical protein LUC44_06175 [Prevotellaceae bacterium]|nr:hypothetical protein [Prevotellaceae bacterium]
MKRLTYEILEAINKSGIDNSLWGLCRDIQSTKDYFGTSVDLRLGGMFIYVYRDEDGGLTVPDLDRVRPVYSLATVDGILIDFYRI